MKFSDTVRKEPEYTVKVRNTESGAHLIIAAENGAEVVLGTLTTAGRFDRPVRLPIWVPVKRNSAGAMLTNKAR